MIQTPSQRLNIVTRTHNGAPTRFQPSQRPDRKAAGRRKIVRADAGQSARGRNLASTHPGLPARRREPVAGRIAIDGHQHFLRCAHLPDHMAKSAPCLRRTDAKSRFPRNAAPAAWRQMQEGAAPAGTAPSHSIRPADQKRKFATARTLCMSNLPSLRMKSVPLALPSRNGFVAGVVPLFTSRTDESSSYCW